MLAYALAMFYLCHLSRFRLGSITKWQWQRPLLVLKHGLPDQRGRSEVVLRHVQPLDPRPRVVSRLVGPHPRPVNEHHAVCKGEDLGARGAPRVVGHPPPTALFVREDVDVLEAVATVLAVQLVAADYDLKLNNAS